MNPKKPLSNVPNQKAASKQVARRSAPPNLVRGQEPAQNPYKEFLREVLESTYFSMPDEVEVERIESKFDSEIDRIDEDIVEVKTGMDRQREDLEAQIKELAKKVDDLTNKP